MNKKPTISLCMIVKDEADFLKSCLDSVKDYVDEMIIVDTGSKDDTIKIAESFGAKVIEHEWKDNFSDARNVSLKHATKDWILILDADETISEKDLKEMKKLLEDKNADAYSLVQRNYFKDRKETSIEVSSKDDKYPESKKYNGWFPSRLVRLFRNNKDYEFTGIIHELIEQSIEIKEDNIVPSQIPIHHFRVDKDQKFNDNKKQKYLEMGLKQIETTPDEPKPYYEVGQIYLSDEEYDKAIELFEKAIKIIDKSKDYDKHKGTYVYLCLSLGKAYLKTGKFELAIHYLKKFLENFPNAHIVHFFLGQAYSSLGKVDDAIKHYQTSAKLYPADEEIHNNLANLYSRVGKFELAVQEFKIALKLSPNNATINRNLGATYFVMREPLNALKYFKRSVELQPEFEKDLGGIISKIESLKDKFSDVEYSHSIG